MLLKYKNNQSALYLFYEKCLKYNESKVGNIVTLDKYDNGKDLWNEFLKQNKKKFCEFLKDNNLFKYENRYYYHRLYSSKFKQNISTDGRFPDISYYRLKPNNKNDYKNVISYTYEIQNYIYSYQHPMLCNDKKFLIIKGYNSGHGSEIHVLTSYLSLAISLGRIAILDPYFKNSKAVGSYCLNEKNWLCFIEQLTNCSINESGYKVMKRYRNERQLDKYLYINNDLSCRKLIPKVVYSILENTPIYNHKILQYWRIQASTYVFRLNARTEKKTNEIN